MMVICIKLESVGRNADEVIFYSEHPKTTKVLRLLAGPLLFWDFILILLLMEIFKNIAAMIR